jgi:mono/diheme cytochrome c family protein
MVCALPLGAVSAADAAKPAAAPAAKPGAAPAAAGGAMPANIWDGVYTNAQAKRGDVVYAQHCAMCHMVDMGGKEPAPELAGDNFLSKWIGHDLGELYTRVATTMPAGNPGILKPNEVADVVALLLQANNFKGGQVEMKPDEAALKKVVIKKKGT